MKWTIRKKPRKSQYSKGVKLKTKIEDKKNTNQVSKIYIS